MANSQRGEVVFTLDKKEYVLVPTFDSICVVERKLGRSMMAMAVGIETLSHHEAAVMVWEFIKGKDKEKPGIKTIGRGIVAEGMLSVIKQMGTVMSTAMGGRKDEDDNDDENTEIGEVDPNA